MIRNKDLENAIYDYLKTFRYNNVFTSKILNHFNNYNNVEIHHALNHLYVNKCIFEVKVNNVTSYKLNYERNKISQRVLCFS